MAQATEGELAREIVEGWQYAPGLNLTSMITKALASVREQERAEIEALRAEVRSKSEQIDKLHRVCNEKAVLTNDLASARFRIEALERQVKELQKCDLNKIVQDLDL